jgi:hypothetical protein
VAKTKKKAAPAASPVTSKAPTKAKKASRKSAAHLAVGEVEKSFEVGLSYRLVELFSEGLYTSANKAFEELVTNSFDAGAQHVQVLLPSDPTKEDSTIAVIDDGEGMNALGLEQLWQIGSSQKRSLKTPPLNRMQIGKFGIGKLATYVLANELTYICKSADGEYHATTMDYGRLDNAATDSLTSTKRVRLEIRKLSETDAKNALADWLALPAVQKWKTKLFGPKSTPTWTAAILSALKPKANEIEHGRLKWLLRTALPLRDDFAIWVNGDQLASSKAEKSKIGRWRLGDEVDELPKPAPTDEIEARTDKKLSATSDHRHGLYHPQLGRITGYAEGFKEILTQGKSKELGRSYGFFVYVRGRLVNVDDEYFGIDSNLLKHGVFSRFRMVVHADALDSELQSTREALRDGPRIRTLRNVLHGVFNAVRPKIEEAVESEEPAKRLGRRVAETPSSLTRKPLVALARAALEGKRKSRFIVVPSGLSKDQRNAFLKEFAARVESETGFVSAVDLTTALAPDDPIAVYDAATSALRLNVLHPFVGTFIGEFSSTSRRQPLEVFALSEVLLEAHLFQADIKPEQVDEILATRDELLRVLARRSGRRTANLIAQDLSDARNDKRKLEIEIVAAFESLGFEASHIGGSGNPDGAAHAHLSATDGGQARRYSVTLEAKSTEEDDTTVTAKTVGVSGIARHRTKIGADHALVVGASFSTRPKKGVPTAVVEEIQQDRELTKKTITLIKIDDLARLVRLAPLRQIGPSALKELFESCSTDGESKAWVDKVEAIKVAREPFKDILETIWSEQRDDPNAVVKYAALRVALKSGPKKIRKTEDELRELCRTMSAMAPSLVKARIDSVELEVPPKRVLEAIEVATDEDTSDN